MRELIRYQRCLCLKASKLRRERHPCIHRIAAGEERRRLAQSGYGLGRDEGLEKHRNQVSERSGTRWIHRSSTAKSPGRQPQQRHLHPSVRAGRIHRAPSQIIPTKCHHDTKASSDRWRRSSKIQGVMMKLRIETNQTVTMTPSRRNEDATARCHHARLHHDRGVGVTMPPHEYITSINHLFLASISNLSLVSDLRVCAHARRGAPT